MADVSGHTAVDAAALALPVLDDTVVLDVTVDGHGFALAAPPDSSGAERGHGPSRCGPRLRALGGALTVESAPGEGTLLSAAVPLEALP
ncbi:hypothetical protein [Streptomyces sp. HD]|uniref:hypothetical protein n=1 Tax=Streptomyces sp. HD TaxID=3020892 RepID=UPI002FEE16B5